MSGGAAGRSVAPHLLPTGIQLVADPAPDIMNCVLRARVLAWRAHTAVDEAIVEWGDRWDALSRHRILMDATGRVLGGLRFSLHASLEACLTEAS